MVFGHGSVVQAQIERDSMVFGTLGSYHSSGVFCTVIIVLRPNDIQIQNQDVRNTSAREASSASHPLAPAPALLSKSWMSLIQVQTAFCHYSVHTFDPTCFCSSHL
jgi:hypothetical protein